MSIDWNIFLYIFFGALPALIWLFYYLKKDVHPESNSIIIKIFLWGALLTVPLFFVQVVSAKILNFFCQISGFLPISDLINIPVTGLSLSEFGIVIFYWVIIIALSEEFFKYLAVRLKVMNSPELDEPLDIMLYMVIAALGFAAVENTLYGFVPAGIFSFEVLLKRTIFLSFLRFIGGTFLHTLCSAVVGYALAVGLCKIKHRWLYTVAGLFIATTLHGLYDFSIIGLEGDLKIIIPLIILAILAILTSFGFEKLKKLKSVCSLKEIYGKQIKT
jgi:RsiW-degrading membrane proteinase PrsW (M82 family)